MLSSQRHRVKGFGAFENNVNLCLIAANCKGTIKLEFPLIFHRHSGCFEELSESSSFEWLWNSRMRLPFYSLAFSKLYILKLLPSRSLSEPSRASRKNLFNQSNQIEITFYAKKRIEIWCKICWLSNRCLKDKGEKNARLFFIRNITNGLAFEVLAKGADHRKGSGRRDSNEEFRKAWDERNKSLQ